MSDPVRTVMGWLGGLMFVGAALGSIYLTGRLQGAAAEKAVWVEKQAAAVRATRQTEVDLNAIAAASAKRFAEKERLLNERALQRDAEWRSLLASLPRYRLPAAVGVQLNAAGGLPAATAVAGAPRADPDAQALDKLVDLADTLDTVRANYAICAANIGRLSEARDWYESIRERVNAR